MSSEATGEEADEMCASCGIAGGGDDNVTLKNCTACYLVKYCSVNCQRNDRAKHKRACKKRAAELNLISVMKSNAAADEAGEICASRDERDKLLFKQPESSHLGECPICLLPLPIGEWSAAYHPCCSKMICNGCIYAGKGKSLGEKCPFCRTTLPEDDAEANAQLKKRVAANDPFAILAMATSYYQDGDYIESLELFIKAAELGDIQAHYDAALMYMDGEGDEVNMKKGNYHLEVAAIGGHVEARYTLGMCELNYGNPERAMKHFIIAANLGLEDALAKLKEGYVNGQISKDDFGEALRAYQRAADAAKSPQREEAARNEESLNIRPHRMQLE